MTDQLIDSTHEAAAEKIIGALLYSIDYFPLVDIAASNTTLWPPYQAKLWDAIKAGVHKHPITPEILADRTGADVDRLYSYMYAARGMDDLGLNHHLDILVRRGQKVIEKQIALQLQAGTIDRNTATRKLEMIDKIGVDTTDASAIGVADRAEDYVMNRPSDGVRSGAGLMDAWTWNWLTHELTLLIGKYKGRKSTVMRNIILGLAAREVPVTVALLEGTRRSFWADCVAMVANYILDQGGMLKTVCQQDGLPSLSGKQILVYDKWKSNPLRWSAYTKACEVWRMLPITVYDKTDRIADPQILKSKFQRAHFDGKLRVGAIDYIQKMRFSGSIYERMTQSMDMVSELSELALHQLVLSQQSEEGIKRPDDHSPSAKGGGDLPAEADQMLIPNYKAEALINPSDIRIYEQLFVKLHLGRATRGRQTTNYTIEPASGIMLRSDDTPDMQLIPDALWRSSQPPLID